MLRRAIGVGWMSGRFWFRPFDESDVTPAYLDTLNSSEYMRFSRQSHIRHTPETTRQYLVELRDGGGELISCRLLPVDAVVATVSVRCTAPGVVDLGLMTFEGHAGKGLGREIWQLVVEFVVAIAQIQQVTAATHANNTPMRRIAESTGFTRVKLDDSDADFASGETSIVRYVRNATPGSMAPL